MPQLLALVMGGETRGLRRRPLCLQGSWAFPEKQTHIVNNKPTLTAFPLCKALPMDELVEPVEPTCEVQASVFPSCK